MRNRHPSSINLHFLTSESLQFRLQAVSHRLKAELRTFSIRKSVNHFSGKMKDVGFFLQLGSQPVWEKAGFLAHSRLFVLYTGYFYEYGIKSCRACATLIIDKEQTTHLEEDAKDVEGLIREFKRRSSKPLLINHPCSCEKELRLWNYKDGL